MLPKICLLIFLILNFGHFANGLSLQELMIEAKNGPIIHELAEANPTGATLDISLPPEIKGDGPQELYEEAKDLNAKAGSLLALIEELLAHFDSNTGDEIQSLNQMVGNLTELKKDLDLVLKNISTVQNNVIYNDIRIQNLTAVLGCLQESNCTEYLRTTTTEPPPEAYNCTGDSDDVKNVSNAGDSGNWSVSTVSVFDGNCEFTIQSTKSVGLWININLTISGAEDGASVEILGSRESAEFYNESTSIVLKGQQVLIVPNGTLAFSVNYTTTDPCASKSCGNGNCTYLSVTNNPFCICQACYTLDSSGSCTVSKPDPCLIYGDYCTDGGGTCFKNATTCTYYCNCPANPTNCPASYCEPSGNTCGQKFDAEKYSLLKNWFF